tara:strand:+ start:880 stop:1809 length:930 start_codon:yes stop_codon:yes gene_type:complete
MSFANLKSNKTDVSKLVSAAQSLSGGGDKKKSYEDERMWKPTVDDNGNGFAVIRFLPAAEGQELPWVRYFDHFFKGPTGQWYIEKSLTTMNQNDPVSEYNSRLWNSGHDEDKETARKQKRRLHYVSNILVVSDPSNPANEGKVFLYDFGKKIFDKIMDVMQPQFPGEEPINPFDFWNGADFQLKIRNVAGYRNYDKSEFKSTSGLFDGDETKLEATYNQLHELQEFVDPTNYKTYDELKSRLEVVLGEATGTGSTVKNESLNKTAESVEPSSAPTPVVAPSAPEPEIKVSGDEDDNDTLSYFAKLAAED